jgi:hypothetical protein
MFDDMMILFGIWKNSSDQEKGKKHEASDRLARRSVANSIRLEYLQVLKT